VGCTVSHNVFFASVFYVGVFFGPSTSNAILESPAFNIHESVCLNFFYQISTSTVRLDIYISTSAFDFRLTGSLNYTSQSSVSQWNKASFFLRNGVTKIKFVATKFGFTSDQQFIRIDRIMLGKQTTDCANSGKSLRINSFLNKKYILIYFKCRRVI